MVVTKEIIPVFYTQQSPEALRVKQNSFVRFIDENKGSFERHSSWTYDLRDEEEGWKNSQTLDSVTEKSVELAFLLYPQVNNLNNKQLRKVSKQIRINVAKVIFGNSSEKDRLIVSFLPYLLSVKQRRHTPQSDALTETLEESFNDFRTSYFEAREPLVLDIRESKTELMGKFEDFLLSNPSNLFAFGDFVSDKKNGAQIQAIRPFLASLADSEESLARDKKEGILHRVVKKWTDELKEKPAPATIDQFAASIKSPNVLEWLKFAAQGEDIANFLRNRPDVSNWTSELKNALTSFISSKYFGTLSSIEKDLGQFRRTLNLKAISQTFSPKLEAEIEEATAEFEVKEPEDSKKKIPQETEKEQYPIGMLTKGIRSRFEVRVLAEEELIHFLQKEADSLAPADQRMIGDLEKIFLSLRQDPYGLGTKKLHDMFVGVGNRSLPLRSIDPGKRIGLSRDHPDSHDIRIVYVIYKNNGAPVIGLEGVYRHDDYIGKFKFGK